MERGAWQATVHRVAKSQTQLKRLNTLLWFFVFLWYWFSLLHFIFNFIIFLCACLLSESSLMTQMIKNLPATQEIRVQSMSWEDPLEKGMATHSVFLPGESPWTEEGSQRV